MLDSDACRGASRAGVAADVGTGASNPAPGVICGVVNSGVSMRGVGMRCAGSISATWTLLGTRLRRPELQSRDLQQRRLSLVSTCIAHSSGLTAQILMCIISDVILPLIRGEHDECRKIFSIASKTRL